ncbi:MAG: GNAT family N-acetyltransferase [Pseudomonadota bacterium]
MIVREAESTQDFDMVRRLRHEVFVVEQNVPPEEEWDGTDAGARHLLASVDGVPMATLRWRIIGDTAKIERVCVAKDYRGGGHGAALMRAVLDLIQHEGRAKRVKLGAQVSALKFYERLGFRIVGAVYLDAGIDHRDMVRDL